MHPCALRKRLPEARFCGALLVPARQPRRKDRSSGNDPPPGLVSSTSPDRQGVLGDRVPSAPPIKSGQAIVGRSGPARSVFHTASATSTPIRFPATRACRAERVEQTAVPVRAHRPAVPHLYRTCPDRPRFVGLTQDISKFFTEPIPTSGGRGSGNSRNGGRAKTVLTDVGPVEVKVPRDTSGTFEPQIVKKRQRRLTGVDEMVLSLSAKGLTHGEIAAHLAEVYGAEVSKQTISTITETVMEGMAEWQNRPLDRVYPVLFVDAINVKIRDGQVANRPIYVVMAVTVDGTRDILGIWAGEGAKYWLHVFTELKNRGLDDVLMLVCDGLKGLPEAVEAVWPRTIVQTCVVHLNGGSNGATSSHSPSGTSRCDRSTSTSGNDAEAHHITTWDILLWSEPSPLPAPAPPQYSAQRYSFPSTSMPSTLFERALRHSGQKDRPPSPEKP